MMQYKHLTTSICMLALAGAAQAAELGDVAPRSYIGQPLAVDIDLVSLAPEEVANLPVRLAQADVYRGANVSMNPALASVRMQVERRGTRQILHVTTTRPVDADYLHLYVELGAPGKSEVRLVTVWLQHDPNPPPPPQPVAVAVAPAAPPIPLASAMTPAQAEQITAQARTARAAAAAKPAATSAANPGVAKPPAAADAAPVRDRTKPAPLPSVHEAETGKPGEVKAAGEQAQVRRIAGVLVSADGKPITPPGKEEAGEVPMSVSQALLPLAPLPLPKGVKRPAPASCPSGGMPAKECVALDSHNTEIASKLTELEGKLKALQGALGGTAPAAAPAPAAKGGAAAAPALAPHAASSASATSKAANAGANGTAGAAASAGRAASLPAKATPASANTAAAAGSAPPAAGGASSAQASGKGAASARASASLAEQGEMEAHAAKAAAGASASASAASAASAASGEAAASGAASASSVPTKQVRVLPKLKYKKEKEKPAEQSSNTIPLIAGGVGLLALLGGGLVVWRKKSAGKGPLKIWQGFRKKKEEPEFAPVAEPTPESVA